MQNLQSNAKKMIYGEAAAQLTAPFVLLMIKASVNLPRVIFRSFLQKSQHPQNHRQMFVILPFISSHPAFSKENKDPTHILIFGI